MPAIEMRRYQFTVVRPAFAKRPRNVNGSQKWLESLKGFCGRERATFIGTSP
jgi:hypothetical protein